MRRVFRARPATGQPGTRRPVGVRLSPEPPPVVVEVPAPTGCEPPDGPWSDYVFVNDASYAKEPSDYYPPVGLVSESGRGHVFWQMRDATTNRWRIWHSYSDDFVTWSAQQQISEYPAVTNRSHTFAYSQRGYIGKNGALLIAASGTNVDLYEGFLMRSTDDGLTWSLVAAPSVAAEDFEYKMAVDVVTKRVYYAWKNDLSRDQMYCSFSDDNGDTWSDANLIVTAPTTSTQLRTIAVLSTGGVVVVCQWAVSGSARHIFFFSDDGITWEERGYVLPVNTGGLWYSFGDHGNGIMHWLYSEHYWASHPPFARTTFGYARSDDYGATWSDWQFVDTPGGDASSSVYDHSARLSVDFCGRVHILCGTYYTDVQTTQISHMISDDQGLTWQYGEHIPDHWPDDYANQFPGLMDYTIDGALFLPCMEYEEHVPGVDNRPRILTMLQQGTAGGSSGAGSETVTVDAEPLRRMRVRVG